MIKRIELVNFMSHQHTVIEPADGLTVLVGPNNCGKSAVVTALQILCYNENSTYVTRHGEKECSITVETEDGHVVCWQRKRNTITYTIDGKLFDRLRSSVPDELHAVLRLPKVALDKNNDQFDIHFGQQKDPIFLLNESGRAAAGFFAASSDASRLIEMQKLHVQRVRDANRELKRVQQDSTVLQSHLDQLTAVPDLVTKIAQCEQQQIQIERSEQKLALQRTAIEQLGQLQFKLQCLTSRAKALARVDTVPELKPTGQLTDTIRSVSALRSQLSGFDRTAQVLAATNPPPTVQNTARLSAAVESLKILTLRSQKVASICHTLATLPPPPELESSQLLSGLKDQILATNKQAKDLRSEQRRLNVASKKVNAQFDEMLASDPTCPTCLRPLTKQQLLDKAKQVQNGSK